MAPTSHTSPTITRLLYCIAILLVILITQIAYNSLYNATSISLPGTTSSTSSSSTGSDTHASPSSSLRGDHILPSILNIKDPRTALSSYLYRKSPPAMPSVRVSEEEEKATEVKRKEGTIYGGKGDKPHLGGFTDRDEMGLSLNLFDYMMGPLAIKSVVDVGCGKGISTKEFLDRGARVLCVEGSHDGVTQSLLPPEMIVEHDFSRGPWWPEETYDAAWSVEFLEHVGRPYMLNYMPIFKKSALIFVTSSGFGGWHHVEVHAHWWWRARFEAQGFIFSQELTDLARKFASDGVHRNPKLPDGQAQHLIHGLRVFINPEVASLPQHHHLIGGGGCYDDSVDNNNGGLECTGPDELPGDYLPLLNCKWEPNRMFKILQCEKNSKATIPNQKPQFTA